tara:strand:+ start:3966 stop:4508 length:543 start_codon:yes stop_codon:yes gene_type:complete
MRLLMLLVLLFPVLSFGSEEDNRYFKEKQVLAEQGEANAQYLLGAMYSLGKGVPKDYKEAVKWYRKAADQGLADAQSNLGTMYEHGKGVPEDDKEAVKWYRLAADQGNADAQGNLALKYVYGEGVPKDNVLAYMWYNIAGANGYDVEVLRVFFMDEISQADIAKAQEMTMQYIKDHPDVY